MGDEIAHSDYLFRTSNILTALMGKPNIGLLEGVNPACLEEHKRNERRDS